MARLPYVDAAQAPEAVKDVLANLAPLNIFRMLAHAESSLRRFVHPRVQFLDLRLTKRRQNELSAVELELSRLTSFS